MEQQILLWILMNTQPLQEFNMYLIILFNMNTQEQKELLIKDLCARLPYEIIIEHEGILSRLDTIFMCDSISISSTSMDEKLSYNLDLNEIKPCLYPLSSMTDEQKKELDDTLVDLNLKALSDKISSEVVSTYEIDFYNKNHFDYRGLIPMGLAMDASELNIY